MITLLTLVNLVEENKELTVGAYHPLTKHLNLVAEYSNVESESNGSEADLETRYLLSRCNLILLGFNSKRT